IDLQKGFAMTATLDWHGYKLHARIKIASGANQSANNPTGIQVYASSYNAVDGGTAGYHFKGAYSNAVAGNGWNDYVVDISAPDANGFDPTKIVNLGVRVQTGNGMTADGGTNPVKPIAAVIYVDSFWLEGTPCMGAGGTGGTGGGGGTAGGSGGT